MAARRRTAYGAVEQLPSGRWRARHRTPDGQRRSRTFETRRDAEAYLADERSRIDRRTWRAPDAAAPTVLAYAQAYLERPDLREGTRELYEGLWRRHLAAAWADVPVDQVTPQRVRSWHTAAARHTGPTALAQAYRLLRALLNVAVSDEVIPTNPCRLRQAGNPKPARPSRALTPAEVGAVAAAMPARYRTLVLVLAWCALRFGEAAALQRQDVLDGGARLRIDRSVREVRGRALVGPPKSDAGRRTVAVPATIAAALAAHLEQFVDDEPDALVFGTANGTHLNRGNFGQTFRRACDTVGLPPTRPHELRHTGSTVAAAAGASTAELMRRLGHASPAAALIYQHAASERDVEIARALDGLVTA